MLFHVKMTVNLPLDMTPARAAGLKAEEKAAFRPAARSGFISRGRFTVIFTWNNMAGAS